MVRGYLLSMDNATMNETEETIMIDALNTNSGTFVDEAAIEERVEGQADALASLVARGWLVECPGLASEGVTVYEIPESALDAIAAAFE